MPVLLELEFCLIERAGIRVTPNESGEVDEEQRSPAHHRSCCMRLGDATAFNRGPDFSDPGVEFAAPTVTAPLSPLRQLARYFCSRPEVGASRRRPNADASPGIASARHDTHLTAGSDEQQRGSGRGRDGCICPAKRKTARRHGPPRRSPRYEQSSCPRSGGACTHPNPRLGSQALTSSPARRRRRTQQRTATSPPRCAFLKAIVTSAATARALRHGGSREGPLLLRRRAVVRSFPLPHPGGAVARRCCSRGSDAATSRRVIAFMRQKSARWRVRDRSACSLPVSAASSRDYVWSP
jgi:hypothetical protein